MPIYEYRCEHCQHQFERFQKHSDAPLQQCPACGQNTVKKLMSAAGFRLKGSGWYETDFKGDDEPKKNLVSADAGDAKKTDSQETTTQSTQSASESKSTATSDSAAGSAVTSKPAASTTTSPDSTTKTKTT